MSVLTGPEIRKLVLEGEWHKRIDCPPPVPAICIDPFDSYRCGPNSYDVTLSPQLLAYIPNGDSEEDLFLDMKKDHTVLGLTIPEDGLILQPGQLYLGCTNEKIGCSGLVPWIDGRSSVGRLGINIHSTAGRGDDGFGWPHGASFTLEISVVQPVRVYPNVRIGQVTFFTIEGDRQPYAGRYQTQDGPVPSRLWKDFLPKEQTGG